MSNFLKTPKDALSLGNLHAISGKYMLEELQDDLDGLLYQNHFLDDDGVKELEKIQKWSNNKLRMYGTAKELAENLKIYRQFPGMDKFFDTVGDLYCMDAVIYESLSGGKYICKSDLFVIFQNMALSIFPGMNREENRVPIKAQLNWHQHQNPLRKLEFIKFDQQVFEEIEKEFREGEKVCYKGNLEIKALQKELNSGNFVNLLSRFQIFDNRGKNHVPEVRALLEMVRGQKHDAREMAQFLLQIAITTSIQTVMDKRPVLFLPSRKNSEGKTVRVFEVGSEQFVMKAEFFKAIKQGYKCDKNGRFLSMNMQEVEEKYGKKIKDLEFIQVPILRAKHRAVPMYAPLSVDTICILAVDAFFELAKTLIFEIRFFQKLNIHDLEAFLEGVEVVFLTEEKNPYFISMDTMEQWHSDTVEFSKKYIDAGTTKDVRNAKKDGFTLQNLKNELAHLGLLDSFPDVQNHAEVVYSEVDKNKKERFLRTCDLFDAVEQCQLLCILDRIPNYKKFLHNQKGCQRVYGYKCAHCEEHSQASTGGLPKI